MFGLIILMHGNYTYKNDANQSLFTKQMWLKTGMKLSKHVENVHLNENNKETIKFI